MRILLVEDEEKVSRFVSRGLTADDLRSIWTVQVDADESILGGLSANSP